MRCAVRSRSRNESDHIVVASLIGQGKIGKGDVAEIVGDEVVQAFPHLIGAAVGHAGAGGRTGGQAGNDYVI